MQKMNAVCENELYKKGDDMKLDLLYSQYRKSRIQAGDAWRKVLTEENADTDIFVSIWKKERTCKLRVQEVKKLMVGVVILV